LTSKDLVSVRQQGETKVQEVQEQAQEQVQEIQEQANEVRVQAQEQVEQANVVVDETIRNANSLINESSNTSLAGLLNLIVSVSNKLIRVLKLKRSDWNTKVKVKDLKEVRDKVVEYYDKFSEINPNDPIMRAYSDAYKLSAKRIDELNIEFTVLVKTGNLNESVYSGGRRVGMFKGHVEVQNMANFMRTYPMKRQF